MESKMITLQHYNGKKWVDCSTWTHEELAWMSLGKDNVGYRTVDGKGEVLTDKSTTRPCMYCGTETTFHTVYVVRKAVKPPHTPYRWKKIGVSCEECIDIKKKPNQIEYGE